MKPIVYFVLTAILIFTASMLIQPFHVGAQINPPLSNCRLSSTQPTDSMEMNTVVIGTKVKTILVEKHLLDCPTNVAGLVLKTDVSLIIEKFEDLAISTVPPKYTVESITCIINPNMIQPICQKFLPAGTVINQPCVASNVASPIEMNTVTTSNGIIKTIKVEKQLFGCTGADPADIRIRDITTFTDILENTAGTILKKSYQPVICMIDVTKAKLVACRTIIPNDL